MFDIESERGIIAGKIFDVKITVVVDAAVRGERDGQHVRLLATTAGAPRQRSVCGRTSWAASEYWIGRGLAFVFIALMFFALYKFLPVRRVRRETAWVAAPFTSVCVRGGAHRVLVLHRRRSIPRSLYTGTLTAIVVVDRLVLLCLADLHPRRRSRPGLRAQACAKAPARGLHGY